MNRNLVFSGAIAAAIHGGLLALPGGPAPKPSVPSPVVELKNFTLVKEADPPEVILENSAEEAPPRTAPRPRGIDEVVAKAAIFETAASPIPHPDVRPVRDAISRPVGWAHEAGEMIPGIPRGIDLDNQPRTRVQVAPQYPHAARAQGLTGEVWVEFVVDESGRVLNPRVVRASDRIFEEPTLRAVAKWRFEPGRHLGQVVRFRMSVPVVFNLNE